MSVPRARVRAAYGFFLGRRPPLFRTPKYASVGEMNRLLMASEEFRASDRAGKTRLGWPLQQHFVSHRARVIYGPIGKNACTFLKRQMVRVSDVPYADHLLPDIHVLTDHVRSGMQLSDYSAEEAARIVSDPAYVRFAVLRDPADRLLSAYMEKLVLNRMNSGNHLHTAKPVWAVQRAQGRSGQDRAGQDGPDFDRGVTFREFATWVTAQDPATLDAHWRPQHLYLEGVAWDCFYPFDRLDLVVDMLEARGGRPLPRLPENRTGSGEGEAREGAADLLPAEIAAAPRIARASFFDEDLSARVARFYARDRALLDEARARIAAEETKTGKDTAP